MNNTKLLLDLYKKYKPKVGTREMKSFKRLWETISTEVTKTLKKIISPSQCENRWRVLERAYKKYLDNQNSTGQSRKYFEYLEEMNDIFRGRRNVDPPILLSNEPPSEEIQVLNEDSEVQVEVERKQENVRVPRPSTTSKRKRNPIINRNETLELMRKDKREYHAERLKIEKEKLESQKDKVLILRERNTLIREKNNILKNKKCCCSKE